MTKSAFKKATKNKVITAETDNLPRWDFSKFYPEVDSPEFEADFKKLEAWSADFTARYEGKIASLSGDELADALNEDIQKDDLAGKLLTYVSLKAVQDSKKYSPAEEAAENRYSRIASEGAFFSYELKQIEESAFKALLAGSKKLQEYAPRLERVASGYPAYTAAGSNEILF